MSKNRQTAIARELRKIFYTIPYYDAQNIIQAAMAAHLRRLPPSIALWLSAIAYIRHEYTDYNTLLNQSLEIEAARFFTKQQINDQLHLWGATRFLSS